MKKIYSCHLTFMFLLLTAFSVNAQVSLTATAGTTSGTFTTLKGAFDAINAGTHQGDIVISINGNTTEGTTPATLNSTGAGSAIYTSVLIQPTVDGVSISGNPTTGFGVIQLKGSDNVTIDGDNPNTGGTNRNLSIINTTTSTLAYGSVIRIATVNVAAALDANNITIRNCIITGSASGRNASANTSTTGSENASFGIVAGANGGTTAIDAPTAITSVTGILPASTTVNNLVINNNAINSCARAVAFLGGTSASSTGVTVSNNLIGDQATTLSGVPPFIAPTTTVYTKGIYIQGTNAYSVTTNTIRNILSYVGTTMNAIEVASTGAGTGAAIVNSNTINGVVNNGTSGANGIILSGTTWSSLNVNSNNVVNIQTVGAGSASGINISGAPSAGIVLLQKDSVSTIYARSTSGFAANGITIASGSVTVQNNVIRDLDAVGNNSTTGTIYAVRGLRLSGGTNHKIYHNTVSLAGSLLAGGTGVDVTAAFTITTTTITGVDVRNNIFSNTMTGASAKHACVQIPSGATSSMNLLINNNAYYGSATVNLGMTSTTLVEYSIANFNAAATSPATNWRSYSSTLLAANTNNDNASYASVNAAPLTSATNLHLDLTSSEIPNVEQKGDVTVGVLTDIDGDTRPSAGTTLPDMGADEIVVASCTGTPNTSAITPATANGCVNSTYTMTATGLSTGTGISYQWQSSTTAGGPYTNVTGGTGATTSSYTTPALTAGTFYYVLKTTCASSGLTSLSNEFTLTVNALPSVSVTPTSATFCSPGGTPITLTASGASTYAWSPAAGLSAVTGASVTASPTSTTTYTVTGTDGNGCTNTATSAITVNAAPVITSTTATPSTVCSGGNSQLQVNATTSPASYAFVAGTGAALETITTPVTVTTVTSGSVDDGSNEISPAGFSFTYAGTVYTGFSAVTNGWLKMTATATSSIPTSLTSAGANGIYAFGRDANLNIANGGNLTHGPAAGGKYVFQFTNNSGGGIGVASASAYVTAQIVLWGNSSSSPGKIEIIYGSSLSTPASAGSIGISNATGAYFNAVTGNNTALTTVSTYPVAGTIYSFTPPTFTYSWSPTTFLNDPSIANPVATAVTATTTYTVTVSNGTCSNTGTVTVSLASYNSAVTTQPSTAAVTAGALNSQVLTLDIDPACTAENLTQLNFTNASTLPADVATAKVYYTTTNTFATTILFGSLANPGATFSISGTQALSTTTRNYFWLVYDVACNATNNNTIDAALNSFIVSSTSYTPTPVNPTGTRTIAGLATLFTTTQPSTSTVTNGSINQQMVRVSAPATDCGALTSITFNTNGSTSATDIATARVYYTTSTTFTTTTQFGVDAATPNGSFTIAGSQALSNTLTNYFWLVYDVSCNAAATDVLDAEINSVTIAGNVYAPTTVNPAGTRTVTALYAPTRTDGNSTTAIPLGTQNAQMVYAVISGSAICPGTVTTVNWTATSATATDVVNAKCFYTTTSTFSTANPYGSAVANPATGALTFTGPQLLATGNNYFWVVYDINCSGTVGASLNADINSLIVSSSTIPVTGTATAANLLSAITSFTTVADGEWNNTATWACGNVPPSNATPIIIAHNITVSNTGNIGGSVTINSGKSLTINTGGVLTLGTIGGDNRILTNNGTLAVTGGTLTQNGNILLASGSTFNQSAGAIVIDGNSGVVGSSVSAGTAMMLINSNLGTVAGGTIQIADPNFNATGKAFDYSVSTNPMSWGTGHTLIIGDAASVNPSSNTNGFILEQYTGTGKLAIGNLQISGGIGVNKQASLGLWTTYVNGNLTVDAGSFFTMASSSTGPVVAGNIINNGTITQTTTALILGAISGNSNVVNTQAQSIGGTGVYRNLSASPTAEFTSLTINNSSAGGVTLSVPLRISGTLTMTSGRINTDVVNLLTLGYNATNAGTLTYTSGNIVGPFKRWITAVTGARRFPMGDGTNLKNADINFTTVPATAGSLTARWSTTPPASPEPVLTEGALTVNKTSTQGSWFIDAGDLFAGGIYTSTFTANGSTDIVDYTKTVLIKRPSAGGAWTLDGTHVNTTGSNTTPVLQRTGMTGFTSEFAIGGEANIVLPITVNYFRGTRQDVANLLDWKMECTSGVTITLERSADNVGFKMLNVQSATPQRCLQPFSYVDASPLTGYNYYRLKIVSVDGEIKYSNIVLLINSKKGFELISIVPNPVRTNAVMNVTSAKAGKVQVIITNVSGQVISRQAMTVIAGTNALPLSLNYLAAGTYQVSVSNTEGEMKTMRIVKY